MVTNDRIITGLTNPKGVLGLIGTIILCLFVLVFMVINMMSNISEKSVDAINNNTEVLTELKTIIHLRR